MRSVYKYLGAGIGHLNKILCQTCLLDKKKDLFAISAEKYTRIIIVYSLG